MVLLLLLGFLLLISPRRHLVVGSARHFPPPSKPGGDPLEGGEPKEGQYQVQHHERDAEDHPSGERERVARTKLVLEFLPVKKKSKLSSPIYNGINLIYPPVVGPGSEAIPS